MKPIRTIRLQRLQGQLGDVAYQLTKIHFSGFRSPKSHWRPAVNAYRCARCLRICVDLAGVDKSAIDLEIESGQLTIRGQRELPEPADAAGRPMQVLAMEIDHGCFERHIHLPSSVQADGVTASQHNGLLWIHLPLRPHA
jgi:HSP20 family protein